MFADVDGLVEYISEHYYEGELNPAKEITQPEMDRPPKSQSISYGLILKNASILLDGFKAKKVHAEKFSILA